MGGRGSQWCRSVVRNDRYKCDLRFRGASSVGTPSALHRSASSVRVASRQNARKAGVEIARHLLASTDRREDSSPRLMSSSVAPGREAACGAWFRCDVSAATVESALPHSRNAGCDSTEQVSNTKPLRSDGLNASETERQSRQPRNVEDTQNGVAREGRMSF